MAAKLLSYSDKFKRTEFRSNLKKKNLLHYFGVYCNILPYTAVYGFIYLCIALCCNIQKFTAIHRNMLQ
jgi:hypothetical protein